MSDPRSTPANGRVAAARLKGQVTAERFTEGTPHRLLRPVTDLLRRPDGPRDRQVLLGEAVTLYEEADGWAFVELARDGYVGYLRAEALGPAEPAPTHRVCQAATHVYPAPDMKTPERMRLSLGALVQVTGTAKGFAETPLGHVPARHLAPLDRPEADPVAVAERLLGTPYLWGGNSRDGIDCSGLVQAGCLACGIACPGDSDQQEAALGRPLEADEPLRRGDLLFWKGHVAFVADETRILHANAHHMAVAFEDREAAIARIEAQGDGPVTGRRRLPGRAEA